MSVRLAPQPVFQAFAPNGGFLVGGQLFTYVAGTSTPQATYIDSTQTTPNTNPVILNAMGQANVWLDQTLIYKLTLQDAAGNPLWTVDQIPGGIALSPDVIGNLIYPPTPAEIATGVTIVNSWFPYGNLLRYGLVPNNAGVASNNLSILKTLLNPTILNGPTGLIYSPNTGGAAGGLTPDIYYFNGGPVQIRDGVTLDFNDTTWNFTTTWVTGTNHCSFLMANANVNIQNGTIVANSLAFSGAAFASGSAIGLGIRDGNTVFPSLFDAVFLATYGYTLGNITLQNLFLSINNPGNAAIGGLGILCLSGLQNVRIDNVWVDGQNTAGGGLYYEFGWATNEASRYQRQNSHAHNWSVKNFKCTNLYPSAASSGFWTNGAYNISLDGIYGSNLGQVVAFGSGEAAFLNPWVGQDDIGSLPQNGQPPMTGTAAAGRQIELRNIVGRQVRGTAIALGGASGSSGWAAALPLTVAWIPGTVYAAGAVVYNGSYKYSTVAGGTSSAASPYAGPTSTAPTLDGSVTWVFVAYAGGGGYRGWQSVLAYAVGDIVANGQYLYICTTGGVAPGGTFQGPTGVGTGLMDGSGGAIRWSSVPAGTGLGPAPLNSAFPAFTDQLNFLLDGFDVDGAGFGGTLINFSGGHTTIKNGKITNAGFGIQQSADATQFSIENVSILNGSSQAMRLGFTPTVWTPARFSVGVIRNCFIAGNTFGVVVTLTKSLLIENCRFGYEASHDGIAESTQQYAVFVGVNALASGVVCNNNYVAAATSGTAYFLHDATQTNCVINNPLGPLRTYTLFWEGVQQEVTNITLGAATGNPTLITYITGGGFGTPAFDYIKTGQRVDYSFEIGVTAFTVGAATGNLQIRGLPYPASNSASTNSQSFGSVQISGFTKAGFTNFTTNVAGGTSQFTVGCSGSAVVQATLQVTDTITNAFVVSGSGHYFTST